MVTDNVCYNSKQGISLICNLKFMETTYIMLKGQHTVNVFKILNTFLFLFSNKMLVFRAGIHKFLVKVPNREDPDQTASSKAV